MDKIGKDLFRAIHEGKWLQIGEPVQYGCFPDPCDTREQPDAGRGSAAAKSCDHAESQDQ